jgi:hypothetical protein
MRTLIVHLLSEGYVQSKFIRGRFAHVTQPISFGLAVENFGIKYVGKDHADHLIDTLQEKDTIIVDLPGDMYVALKLHLVYKRAMWASACQIMWPNTSRVSSIPLQSPHNMHPTLGPNQNMAPN